MYNNEVTISVVVPMFNEAANLPGNIERIKSALKLTGQSFEIIPVDDGSSDDTLIKLTEMAQDDDCLRPVGYPVNSGRGRALRTGISHARGKYIMTCDADLSYDEAYLPAMYQLLSAPEAPDMVIGSPYMEGGGTENVPANRLFISKLGNIILSRIMPGNIHTVTGILRGYKASEIQALDLEADGKEIHLEIISKGIAAGFRIIEFPAVLTSRKKGKSKFRFKATAISHILFSFFEKPSILFGVVGSLLVVAGLAAGSYIVYLWQAGTLNPNRPLMTLMVIVLLAGMQVLLFGFLGSLLVSLRREIFRVQRRQGEIIQQVNQLSEAKKTTDYKINKTERVSVVD
ncbi:MAG: glycosyltransferase [candidate division Zixibacteria bacterium]|nr:glycosyltransferase [candidate division Zixibacteria bacterium]